MLKMVPDPPHTTSLEDILMTAANSAFCAQAVAQQTVLLQPRFPVTVLSMASMHDLETLRKPVNSALTQTQIPANPQTLH